MAKKKSTESPSAPRRRRAPVRPAAPPTETAGVSSPDRPDAAADRSRNDGGPQHDEIAEAAYHRYLKRGANDGSDFDDWLEAEQELRNRTSR